MHHVYNIYPTQPLPPIFSGSAPDDVLTCLIQGHSQFLVLLLLQ